MIFKPNSNLAVCLVGSPTCIYTNVQAAVDAAAPSDVIKVAAGRYTNSNWAGVGTINTNNNYSGDPAFVNPASGNYHLGQTSAAIDKGINTGVTSDIDGDTRPQGAAPDLGADEYKEAKNIINEQKSCSNNTLMALTPHTETQCTCPE